MAKQIEAFRNEQYTWREIREVVQLSRMEREVIDVSTNILSADDNIKYEKDVSSRMIDKLSRFIKTSAEMESFKRKNFHLEQYLDEVLSITFPQHEGLKLSLYFDHQVDEGQEDVEEAVIIHRSASGLTMRSGTIEDMVVFLNDIL